MTIGRKQLMMLQRRTGIALAIAVLFCCFASAALASTLDDYQSRIRLAQNAIDEMESASSTETGYRTIDHQKVAEIRKLIPRTENIDWPGGTVATDNAWLHDELDKYDADFDSLKRAAIRTSISERLNAISDAVAETKAATAGEHSKDEDKQKLAEILKRGEYQKPVEADESLFQRLRKKFLEWLADMFPKMNIQPHEPSAGMGSLAVVLQVLLYSALAAGIIFLIYKFFPRISGRFKKRTGRDKNDRVILGERIADDHSSSDLFAEAERLAREGELRLAIRKGYIALLCELSDRKIIGLARHKTNRDYLRDLHSKKDIFENVVGLTGSFERHWYGSQASEMKDWEEFRSLYRRTVQGA